MYANQFSIDLGLSRNISKAMSGTIRWLDNGNLIEGITCILLFNTIKTEVYYNST